jgi:hypothetical protein
VNRTKSQEIPSSFHVTSKKTLHSHSRGNLKSYRHFKTAESQDSAVGIAIGYELEFESRWGLEFSLIHVVQTGSGGHPASYPTGKEGFSPGVKRSRREADNTPATSAEVKKT